MHRSIRLVAPSALAVAVALTGCAASGDDSTAVEESPAASAVAVHWSYEGEEGPDHWGELSADFGMCQDGTQQSPIDLHADDQAGTDELSVDYGTIAEHVHDTGHTFQMDADDDATLEYEGTEYALVQMHFHDPSEHTVDGEAAPVEFHFVHADDDGDLLVVGVLAVEGAHAAAFDDFIAATTQEGDVAGDIDVAAMLPTSTAHYAYEGSLTTPPCSEGVQWLVMQEAIELDAEQIAALETAYAGNARPVQELGGRLVTSVASLG
ncbi:carbonic anhydrase [Agrococcus jejuensis]|uniref:carbonic anhydrase n=1 Tax=Agrococcus jejuensis TaxID=399736 RepID=A0A1G8G9S5_9MICO|nr:carbonic anhydrase family protein [Agrococcus jejuensis]SDH91113.1 carbonic anhydrase [Agrococcus jejuensis]